MTWPSTCLSPSSDDLIGLESYVVLSAQEIGDLPDLTVMPAQLHSTPETRVQEGRLSWRGTGDGLNLIAHGPYVYLPKGTYRVVIKGRCSGQIRFAVQENFGDQIFVTDLPAGEDVSLNVPLIFDAVKMEVAFWGGRDAVLDLERVEFWRI